jgi:asparagine synthase (glutamine-hydrolysing)
MIYGCFTFSGSNIRPPSVITLPKSDPGIRFYPLSAEGFDGGYCLHERLPLKKSDLYYRDEQNDLIVLFSGYIYNRREVASQYNIDADDPEPVMAARMFLLEGPDFVRSLNGDFAIFIGQPAGRRAYLFRDQLGIRPLACSTDSGRLIFSSDITALCRSISGSKPPEREFLLGYFKYVDYTTTPCENVRRVLPGHYLEYSDRGVMVTRYWEPDKIKTDHRLSYEVMLSDLKALVDDAVAIRCDSRFSAGAHVSSGLDSCTVALLARKYYPQQEAFYGYSWSPSGFFPPDPAYDERDLVRSFCSKTGIVPVFSDITPSGFLERVSDFYRNRGYFIEENTLAQAADNGTNLLFSGWGGDEFISTGDRGIETDLLRRLNLRTWLRRNPVRPLRRFIKYILWYTVLPAAGVLQRSVARSFANDARYIKKAFKKSDRRVLANFYFHTSRRQMHLRYLRFYHLQERCESWMVSGYRRGIEYRYPLLDRRIVEYMIRVPSLLLCRTDHFRPLLRIIGEGWLPDDVRLNYSKVDPVYRDWWNELLRLSGLALMEEVEQWQDNPGLSFIDFERLSEDIALYNRDPSAIDGAVLFKALVYIKAVHQFTVDYHADRPD